MAVLLTALMLASLIGCGVSPETTIPTDGTVEQTEPATSAQPPETTQETTIPEQSTFSVQFIDVGQADAALIACDGHYMLIDGGNKADSSRIYSVLKRNEVPVLDLVVGTHAHEDHIGGLPGAYQYTTALKTLCPVTEYDSKAFRDFAQAAQEKGGGITVPKTGDTYALGSAKVTILGLNNGDSTNDTSIVLRIDYGETSFLFTGDAEFEAEKALVDGEANLHATVLKVGHHGSDTSTGYVFLREVMPRYGVISCGKDNSYGHPTETVLSRLRDADVNVFRTDLQGDIFCTSDGKNVTFEVSRNPDADTLGNAGHREPEHAEQAKPESKPVEQTEPKPSEQPKPVAPTAEPETQAPLPQGKDYVLNTNTGKFHLPGCSSEKKISPQNRKEVNCSREELIVQGYEPCKRCHP